MKKTIRIGIVRIHREKKLHHLQVSMENRPEFPSGEREARNRSWSMEFDVLLPRELSKRKGKMEMVKLLRAMLKELGFSKGGAKQIGGNIYSCYF